MKTYPPVDPDFYVIAHRNGMSDDEIQGDWQAYCDDLEKFHQELDAAAEPAVPNTNQDTVAEIKGFFN